MNVNFKQIIEEENLSELFTKKNTLDDEVAKYVLMFFNQVIYN